MKIMLNPGHGGTDSGAVGLHGLKEKDLTLKVAIAAQKYLIQHGHTVIMSRVTDRTATIGEAAKLANDNRVDLVVSIHFNAGGGDGVEAIHSILGGASETLAKRIVESIHKEVGQNYRKTPTYSKMGTGNKDYYGIIRETIAPAVIVECAFIDTRDIEIADTDKELEQMGIAIAKGIINYSGPSDTLEEAISKLHALHVIEDEQYWRERTIRGKTCRGEFVGQLLTNLVKRGIIK